MKTALIITALFTSAIFSAQVGKPFPNLHGSTLDNKSVSVPLKNDKYSLIAVAYSREAEEDLKSWLSPIYDLFIKTGESSGNFDMAEVYDINFLFVPLVSGFKKVSNDFKKGTDKEFWRYIMDAESANIKEIQNQLAVQSTSVPYFYVLDKNGKILEIQSGKYSDAKMDKIEDAVE